MLFEIAVVTGIGLLGVAFTIKFVAWAWRVIYALAPLAVPVIILVGLYMLYAPAQ